MNDGRSRLIDWVWALGLVSLAVILFQASPGAELEIVLWTFIVGVGSLIEVPAVSGNSFSLTNAAAAAVPFVIMADGKPDLSAAAAVYVAGFLIGWMVWVLRRRNPLAGLTTALRRTTGAALYAVLLRHVGETSRSLFELPEDTAYLIGFAIGAAVWFAVSTILWAFITFGRRRISRRYLMLLAAKDWTVGMTLMVAGALLGFGYARLSWWAAVTVAAVPYTLAHLAFHRYRRARDTYWQTIRALARIPEVAGLSPEGHGDRTSDLGVLIAQRIGLSPDEVEDVRLAAMMHDIGRITLNEPSILRMGFTDEDIAKWGSEIISEAPYLHRIAELVRMQHSPYRRPGEYKDGALPMASKIIKASSAYDHATTELGFTRLEALEVLHRGAAYDYDPMVVFALRGIVEDLEGALGAAG